MRTRVASKVAIATSLSLLLIAVPATAAYAAYREDVATRTALPAGSKIAFVDVSHLSRDAALAKVTAAVERNYDRPITLDVAGRTFSTTLRQLGASADIQSAVDEAFRKARKDSFFDRMWRHVFGGSNIPKVKVTTHSPDSAHIAAFVDSVATQVQVAAVDATMALDHGFLKMVHGTEGAKLDTAAATAGVRAAFHDFLPQTLALTPVAPTVSDATYETVVLVHTGENRLYLYKNGVIERVYRVATGSAKYPTPLGKFKVELKRYLPTWHNPHSEWSKDEPETIPPGPHNPLGTRALNISAPGIRIHGTPSNRSIGHSVSHGCIRMHIWDSEALYPLVPKGAFVYISHYGTSSTPASAVGTGPAANADGG